MERLTDKRMKGEGFIPVDPKEYKAFIKNEKPTGKQIYQRLLEIEDILGDDYDLDCLRVIVNQRMSMRDEVAKRFEITKNITVDRLRELVEADREGRRGDIKNRCAIKVGNNKYNEIIVTGESQEVLAIISDTVVVVKNGIAVAFKD